MIKKKSLFVVQLLIIIFFLAIIMNFIKYLSYMYPSNTVRFKVKTDLQDISSVSEKISLYEKYNGNITLNKVARIKKVKSDVISTEIQDNYVLSVKEGDVLNVHQRVAYTADDEILCPELCRVIQLRHENDKFILELDMISNYEIELFLDPTDILIYAGIKEKNIKEVSLTINGITSFAYVSEMCFNETNGGYEIILNELSYNPYIFEDYTVQIYCFIQSRGSYLVFPRSSCYYSLSEDEASIKVKKYDAESNEFVELTLSINSQMTNEEYFYVYNYTENCGEYMSWERFNKDTEFVNK